MSLMRRPARARTLEVLAMFPLADSLRDHTAIHLLLS